MDIEHGEGTWDLMELQAKKPYKMGAFEYDILYKHYKKLVVELKKEKGIINAA